MRFCLEPLPPHPPTPQKKDISLSEPKANSEERRQVLIYLRSNLGRDWVGGVEKFHLYRKKVLESPEMARFQIKKVAADASADGAADIIYYLIATIIALIVCFLGS